MTNVFLTITVGLRSSNRRMVYVAAVLILMAATLVARALLPAQAERVRIYSAVEIDRSPDPVFSFATTPATWPKCHPQSVSWRG
jgi:hypothetical protein